MFYEIPLEDGRMEGGRREGGRSGHQFQADHVVMDGRAGGDGLGILLEGW